MEEWTDPAGTRPARSKGDPGRVQVYTGPMCPVHGRMFVGPVPTCFRGECLCVQRVWECHGWDGELNTHPYQCEYTVPLGTAEYRLDELDGKLSATQQMARVLEVDRIRRQLPSTEQIKVQYISDQADAARAALRELRDGTIPMRFDRLT